MFCLSICEQAAQEVKSFQMIFIKPSSLALRTAVMQRTSSLLVLTTGLDFCHNALHRDQATPSEYQWKQMIIDYTLCLKKTVQNCFCQNFVQFPPILIIFGRKMAKRLKLCEMHSFSTSSNSRHHTTVMALMEVCTHWGPSNGNMELTHHVVSFFDGTQYILSHPSTRQ